MMSAFRLTWPATRGTPATQARLSPIPRSIERRMAALCEYVTLLEATSSRPGASDHAEERPKAENALHETRRLNRRAGLVVKVQ